MPELNECRFCKSMGFGGCEMCTDSRSELKRLKSELDRVKRENDALKKCLDALVLQGIAKEQEAPE